MSLRPLILLALSMPPQRAAYRTCRLAVRSLRTRRQATLDRKSGSFHAIPSSLGLQRNVSARPAIKPNGQISVLREYCRRYLNHQFDLLGSDWIAVRHGQQCPGVAGHSYPLGPTIDADTNGDWLAAQINKSNLPRAQSLWCLIDDEAYCPVDWQLDFKSGYRWHQDAHITKLTIPVDIGADVKVPWELSRLQHLPQLALLAAYDLSLDNADQAHLVVTEIRAQILDFLAQNPPRFGVNWLCPMDVGIRICNLLLAVDLLRACGHQFDTPFLLAVESAAHEHLDHILAQLEWSETGRSNHYLADLAGVAWAAAYLPASPRRNAAMAFAAQEFIKEIDLQFYDDGGGYEGSSNYLRLSSELALYGIAMIDAVDRREPDIFLNYDNSLLTVRPPFRAAPLQLHDHADRGKSVIPQRAFDKLARSAGLLASLERPDGTIVQIGDTDSGVLFRLTPAPLVPSQSLSTPAQILCHRPFVSSLGSAPDEFAEARLLHSLLGDRDLVQGATAQVEDTGDLTACIDTIANFPTANRRIRKIEFDGSSGSDWYRIGFPSFGIYVFQRGDSAIYFRCYGAPPATAPTGHYHDDNLSMECIVNGKAFIEDPGTYLYTPSRAARNYYRSAAVHDGPRAKAWDVAPPGGELFELKQTGYAKLLAWTAQGAAGELTTSKGTLIRAIEITDTAIRIHDGTTCPSGLRELAEPTPRCHGYGRQAENSLPTF